MPVFLNTLDYLSAAVAELDTIQLANQCNATSSAAALADSVCGQAVELWDDLSRSRKRDREGQLGSARDVYVTVRVWACTSEGREPRECVASIRMQSHKRARSAQSDRLGAPHL